MVESAGLQWVETRGESPAAGDAQPTPRQPRGRPRRSRKATEAEADAGSSALTQIETQPPTAS